MKKPYEIADGRAVQRVRQWVEEKNREVSGSVRDSNGAGISKC
jgi:hypothetical protein